MNLTQTNTSLFKRLRFVLVETSRPGNIGAAARAMKTMGFSELVLVNPRFPDAAQRGDIIMTTAIFVYASTLRASA